MHPTSRKSHPSGGSREAVRPPVGRKRDGVRERHAELSEKGGGWIELPVSNIHNIEYLCNRRIVLECRYPAGIRRIGV